MIKYFPFLFLITALLPASTPASHNMGMNLSYECIGNCTLRIHLIHYTDCSSTSLNPSTINITALGTNCTLPTLDSTHAAQAVQITPLCPGFQTKCDNITAILNGFQEQKFTFDYNICNSSGCKFLLSSSYCCRNPAITSGSSNTNQYTEANLDLTLNSCNNSPAPGRSLHMLPCEGKSSEIDLSESDPDGDSLSYHLDSCLITDSSSVSYNTGYSPQQFLGSSWNITSNPVTGILHLNPQPGNQVVGPVCYIVKEWRNGVLLNEYRREMQITVISCSCPNSFDILTGSNAYLSGDTIFTCQTTTSLTFGVTAAQTSDTFRIYMENKPSGATFQDPTNPGMTDTIYGTPPLGQFTYNLPGSGLDTLTFISDDACCPIRNVIKQTFYIKSIGQPLLTGTLLDSAGNPLAGATVVMLQLDSSTTPYAHWNNLAATLTDSTGVFNFCQSFPDSIAIKAEMTNHPGELPSYALNNRFFKTANKYGNAQAPLNVNFSTRERRTTGGTGKIGGKVFEINPPYSGKSNVSILLEDSASGDVLKQQYTDATGYFLFDSLNNGTYYVKADFPLVKVQNAQSPKITLDATNNQKDSLDFDLSRYRLILNGILISRLDDHMKNQVVFPNPGKDEICFSTDIPLGSTLKLFNLHGAKVWEAEMGRNNSFDVGFLSPGIYIWKLSKNGRHLNTGKWIRK